MGESAGFYHSLDLIVRLWDTVSGRPIADRRAVFTRDGRQVFLIRKDMGIYGLINGKKEPFLLSVSIPGFISRTVPISYEDRSSRILSVDLPLIPRGDGSLVGGYHIWEGRLEGIREIEGVEYGGWNLRVKAADGKNSMLILSNPHRVILSQMAYGLIDIEEETYEPFTVIEQKTEELLMVEHPFKRTVHPGSPVGRIISGMAGEDGKFLWKAEKYPNIEIGRYLIRYLADGKEHFQMVDFNEEKGEL